MRGNPVAALTPYELRQLPGHLLAAGRERDLHRLLALETTAGANAWYEAKVTAEPQGYLDDVGLAERAALEAAEAALARGERPASVGPMVRHSLAARSVRASARQIPPAIQCRLIETRVWGLREVLAVTRAQGTGVGRARALTLLGSRLPQREWEEEALPRALDEARAIPDLADRSRALGELSAKVTEPLAGELLRDALGLAEQLEDPLAREVTLVQLVEHSPPSRQTTLLERLLSLVEARLTDEARARGVIGLAPHLPEDLAMRARSLALTLEDRRAQCWALAALLPALPEGERNDAGLLALSDAGELGGPHVRVELLQDVMPHLDDGFKTVMAGDLLAHVARLDSPTARAVALARAALHLPPDQNLDLRRRAQREVMAIGDRDLAILTYLELVSLMPERERDHNVIEQALENTASIGWPSSRARGLRTLAPLIPPALAETALAVALGIEEPSARAQALGDLAPRLPAELLAEALRAARELPDYARATALDGVLPHLPRELAHEALAALRGITDRETRTNVLIDLTEELPAELLLEAMEVARTVADGDWRARALAGLVPHVGEEMVGVLLERVLAAAGAARDLDPMLQVGGRLEGYEDARDRLAGERRGAQLWWAAALTDLVPVVPDGRRPTVLAEALAAARAVGAGRERAQALWRLLAHVPPARAAADEALAAARQIGDAGDRALALARLWPYVPAVRQRELVDEALASARAVEGHNACAAALAQLVPHLPEPGRLIPEVVEALRHSMDYGVRGRWYAVLARHAPAELAASVQEDAVDMIRRIEGWQAHLAGDGGSPDTGALRAAGEDLCTTVIAVMRHLPEHVTRALLNDALRIARAPERPATQAAAVLAELARHAPEEFTAEALVAALRLDDRERRAAVLASLTDPLAQLAPVRQLQAWSDALASGAERPRADLLEDIRALSPALAALAGRPGAGEAARAIDDAGRWWP